MFDTLDIILSFIIIIFILSVLAQTIQSLFKRLFDLKTRKIINTGLKHYIDITGIDFKKLDKQTKNDVEKVLKNIKDQYRVSDITYDNIQPIIEKIAELPKPSKEVETATDLKTTVLNKLNVKEYKENYATLMHNLSFLIASILCLLLNADSLQMIEKISSDKVIRQMIVQSDYIQQKLTSSEESGEKSEEIENKSVKDSLKDIENLISEYQGLNIGVKWSITKQEFSKIEGMMNKSYFILKKITGILIAAVLVSMGAPFWYNILDLILDLKNKVRQASSKP